MAAADQVVAVVTGDSDGVCDGVVAKCCLFVFAEILIAGKKNTVLFCFVGMWAVCLWGLVDGRLVALMDGTGCVIDRGVGALKKRSFGIKKERSVLFRSAMKSLFYNSTIVSSTF